MATGTRTRPGATGVTAKPSDDESARIASLERQVARLKKERLSRRKADERLRARSTDLAERVKELDCLLSLSRMLGDRSASLSDLLGRVVLEIPRAWQFPADARARLRWNGQTWASPGFVESPWTQQAVIKGRAHAEGVVEIAYRHCPVPEGHDPFLPEEARLLRAIAERVKDIVDLKEVEQELDLYQNRLRSMAAQLSMTEERERRDLAVGLHDRIGQSLAVLKLKLENLRGAARQDEDNRLLDDLCGLLSHVMQETRALSFEISPPILHELGLAPALEWLADHFHGHFGLDVDVQVDPAGLPVDGDVRSLMFRSATELLNNAVKHARARRAEVRAGIEGGWLWLSVRDEGVGFDPARADRSSAAGGFGLFSVRERLEYLGGRLEVDSAPGRGTRVTLWAPLARDPV